jgi:CheY-like chemotaxis protein
MSDQNNTAVLFGADSAQAALYQKKRCVLLVDDDQITCNVVGRIVSQIYDVEIHTSPQNAQDAFVKGKFDLALIDLGMTQMRGDVLEARLRREDPTLVTVLMTGWHLDEGDERASGFDFCIYKPVEMAALLQLIHKAVVLHDQRVAQN